MSRRRSGTVASAPDRAQWAEQAKARLRRAGHRIGGARTAVVELLARQHCCLSAQDVFDRLRAEDRSVGIASVYRALDVLHGLELVTRVEFGSVACFEPAHPSGAHHHHVVCSSCGKVSSFEDRRLEEAIARLARRLEYRVGGHEVVLRGDCPDCRAA